MMILRRRFTRKLRTSGLANTITAITHQRIQYIHAYEIYTAIRTKTYLRFHIVEILPKHREVTHAASDIPTASSTIYSSYTTYIHNPQSTKHARAAFINSSLVVFSLWKSLDLRFVSWLSSQRRSVTFGITTSPVSTAGAIPRILPSKTVWRKTPKV